MTTDYKIPFTGTNNVKLDRLLNLIVRYGAEELKKINGKWEMNWDESEPITVDLVKSKLDSIEIRTDAHMSLYAASYRYHLGRIAYFVKTPSELHSIVVDEDWDSRRRFKTKDEFEIYIPRLYIRDGFHRLMAALVLDLDEININYKGSSEALEHLTRKVEKND